MDTYHNEFNSYPDVGPAQLPTWCAFALGGIVTFLFVYIGIARPAANEMSMMRRQLGTLEQSVWEVAGQKGTADEANDLLAALNEQREQAIAAKESLAEIRELNQQLLVEAERVHSAMAAVSQLGALKDMLLANSDRADQAAEVLSISEDLYHRLASAADTTEIARQTGTELLALREDLVDQSEEVVVAKQNLDELINMNQELNDKAGDAHKAKEKADELIALQDTIISNTGDLADAIETLELTNELDMQFHEAAISFDSIKHWMVEVVAMEPILKQARQTIEPLLDFGNLRHMGPDQLRELARTFTRNYADSSQFVIKHAIEASSLSTAALDDSVTTE